jgi:hypothetical protein
MAAFKDLSSHGIDGSAIVTGRGLATIEEERRAACKAWLARNGYTVDTMDCTQPVNRVVADLCRLFRWEEQFGYTPEPGWRNLDALNDGFEFEIPEGGGHVLELYRADLTWEQEPRWMLGLLDIAQHYSLCQLAVGRRFFVLLVVAPDSGMIGERITEVRVPGVFRGSHRKYDLFEE